MGFVTQNGGFVSTMLTFEAGVGFLPRMISMRRLSLLVIPLSLLIAPAPAQDLIYNSDVPEQQFISGTVTINPGYNLILRGSDAVGQIEATITGSGSVYKEGTGHWLFHQRSPVHSYTGDFHINQGTVELAVGASVAGDLIFGTGSSGRFLARGHSTQTVEIHNDIFVDAGAGPVVIGSQSTGMPSYGQFYYRGDLNLNSAVTLSAGLGGFSYNQANDGRTTFSGVISGNVGTLTLKGDNPNFQRRISLESANTFVGDVVLEGLTVLQLHNQSGVDQRQILPIASTLDLGESGHLWLVENNTVGALNGGESSRVEIAAAGGVPAATLTVGGLGNDKDSVFEGRLRNSTPLALTSPALSLIKAGNRKLTLAGDNDHSGTNTVQGGVLRLTGTFSGNGKTTVEQGGALSGTGRINGEVAVKGGGRLGAGEEIESLVMRGGLTLEDGAVVEMRLGTSSDRFYVTNNFVHLEGTIELRISDAGGFGEGTYTLIDFNGASLTSDSYTFDVVHDMHGFSMQAFIFERELMLVATAVVPEPSVWLLSGVGMIALLVHTQRRSRKRMA